MRWAGFRRQRSTREDDRVLQKGVLKVEGSKSKLDPMNHAENLETLVAHNFGQYPRMATLGNARSLRSLTWWIWRDFANIAPDSKLQARISHRPEWSYRSVWKTRGAGSFPHTMLTLVHAIDGDNDQLLRGELLVIVDVIRSRLKDPEMQEHNTTPILLFSFFGNHQARIIQAHFDGDRIAMLKSPLYGFSTEEQLNANLSVFVRWMANEPVWDTKVI